MRKRSAEWRGSRRLVVGFGVGLTCAALMLMLGLTAVGCGGDSSDADTSASTISEQPAATTEEPTTMSGSVLGDAISATWAEAMQDLVTLLADKPEPASVASQVEQLKEEYIQKLVALGRQGEELDPAEKATMVAGVASAAVDFSDQDWYSSYSDIYGYYATEDLEFSNLISDFNILTQYAFFDLLKEQAPEEAARLGIE